ncbi:MAG: type II toxin-antitoxin system ParD family antitoxin [Gammaproteobacteria bacterium]|nr:type II toxin-antitoxin system ParD family antitoxin [Gammaproteobacteria bacterium]MCW8923232.1 type II toxin-antitoxin system ParD family antitoxin [Gammaproteobacteria bacterium]
MAKNTSITLGDHFDDFITGQVKSGRFGSASEVVRAALRLLENTETRLETLRHMLAEGEQSGVADYNYDELMSELDSENDK